MAQLLTIASILALVGLLGWRFARLFHRQRPARSTGHGYAGGDESAQVFYRAPANDFLRGAADLTFGAVILGLGFFMLMWVIATG
jgi:hypothetical protein